MTAARNTAAVVWVILKSLWFLLFIVLVCFGGLADGVAVVTWLAGAVVLFCTFGLVVGAINWVGHIFGLEE